MYLDLVIVKLLRRENFIRKDRDEYENGIIRGVTTFVEKCVFDISSVLNPECNKSYVSVRKSRVRIFLNFDSHKLEE